MEDKFVVKTNDKEIIRKDTKDFLPGDVYIFRENTNKEKPTRYSGNDLYDTETKNFHIFPKDTIINDTLSNDYISKRSEIINTINKLNTVGIFNGVEYEYLEKGTTRKALPENYDNANKIIYMFEGFGKSPKKPLKIFRYITVFYKGAWYRLNFMRMYHDGRSVHCCMNMLQYDKDNSKKGYGLNMSSEGKFDICYPNSCEDGKYGENSSGNRVYNPQNAHYYSKPEDIAKSFISFVLSEGLL